MTFKKPMLAFTCEDTSTLNYPVYASIKLDGLRMVVLDGVCYSRSMKPIRSKTVQKLFGKPELNGLDGELLYGDWNAHNVFNLTTRACMSTELDEEFDESKIEFAVFDYVLSDAPYQERNLTARITAASQEQTFHVTQWKMSSEEDLIAFEQVTLNGGFEGVMVRDIHGRYKQGRSTAKEGIIGKIKRFSDAEAVVIGFEEKMHNTNEAKTNEIGRTQRSQAQEGMVGAGTLGALVCECDGIRFTMGSGFDDAMRKEVWDNREKYIGQLAKFKFFKVGMKDSYRFPVFLGWRDKEDLSC